MITITNEFSSAGRNFGNKLFTYGVSRLIAEEYEYKLVVPKNSHIQRNGIHIEFPYKGIDGIEIQEPTYYVSDGSMVEHGFEYILKECKDKNIFMDGYFLRYENIKLRKNIIKSYYKDLIGKKDDLNDVIILLRDSNNDSTYKLPNEYYLNILDNLKFNNLYISFDHLHKHQNLIHQLSKYNPILLDMDIISLMKFITTKKTIIGCQGTFSFWGCFLSNAKTIYWPLTKKGANSIDRHVNLTVDDEDRYNFIEVDNTNF
jgi:hypothetical protein